jgi:hypothetical protein
LLCSANPGHKVFRGNAGCNGHNSGGGKVKFPDLEQYAKSINTLSIIYTSVVSMDDFRWFKKHLNEIREKYEGKLVSVLNGMIVAVGDNLEEIDEIITRKRLSGEIKGVPFTGRASEDIAVIHLPHVMA